MSNFLGPTDRLKPSTDGRSRWEDFEFIPQEYRHLVEVQVGLFSEVFTQSVHYRTSDGSRASATVVGRSRAYGWN